MSIIVIFDDIESLRAATQAVADANSATGTPDNQDTPIYRAERVLDSALLGAENKE